MKRIVIKLGDPARQNSAIHDEIAAAASRVIAAGRYIGGPEVLQFEHDFARFTETDACIGVGNGTDALEIALEACGIGCGDRVLVPAMSFAATCEAVLRSGAQPVFVDTDEHGICEAETLISAITPDVRAVVAVHLYGYPVNTSLLRQQIDDPTVTVIEDAAQGHGATVMSKPVGSLGRLAAFSFFPGKNLGAIGDAGAVTTSDPEIEARARRLGNHGRLAKHDHVILGRNSRLDALQAAILTVKLRHLPDWIARRRSIASHYLSQLSALPWLTLPKTPDHGMHAWHHFAITADDRDRLRSHLLDWDIETGVHYPQSLPDLPFVRGTSSSYPALFPRARIVSQRTLSIPVGDHLSDTEVDRIIEALRSFLPAARSAHA